MERIDRKSLAQIKRILSARFDHVEFGDIVEASEEELSMKLQERLGKSRLEVDEIIGELSTKVI